MRKLMVGLGIMVLSIYSCIENTQTEPVFASKLEKTDTPKLFFPGNVTQRGKVHFGSSFSQNGAHIVYTTTAQGKPGTVVTQTFENGIFSSPVPIETDTVYSYSDASISADGNTITLTSNRPPNDEMPTIHSNGIWQFQRTADGWGEISRLKLEMDSSGGFGYPTMTGDKTIYFHHSTEHSEPDIYRAEFSNGKYNVPEKLPYPINTDKFEGDVFVDLQERFILFVGFGRDDNLGESDLYIAFKDEDGWSNVISLGKNVNSYGYDGSPFVTADDQYLIFTSSKHPENVDEHEYFNLFYVNFTLDFYRSMITQR